MPQTHTPPTPIQSLMRWLAAWLAVALCAQALSIGGAALFAHRHGTLEIETQPMLLWRHAGDAQNTGSADAHARAHRANEAHQHAVDDVSVLPAGGDAAAALAAFVAAPAPQGAAVAAAVPIGLHHVLKASHLWAPTAHAVSPPRHPPRA